MIISIKLLILIAINLLISGCARVSQIPGETPSLTTNPTANGSPRPTRVPFNSPEPNNTTSECPIYPLTTYSITSDRIILVSNLEIKGSLQNTSFTLDKPTNKTTSVYGPQTTTQTGINHPLNVMVFETGYEFTLKEWLGTTAKFTKKNTWASNQDLETSTCELIINP